MVKRTQMSVVAAALLALVSVMTVSRSSVRAAEGTYQEEKNWAQLPPGYQWGVISAVGVDSKGNVYAFQRDEPATGPTASSGGVAREHTPSKVVVFDAHGKYLKTWREGFFPYAHGMHVLRDDFIWATDRKAQLVYKFDSDGKLLMTIGRENVAGDMTSTDAFNGASDVVMAPNGDLFVSDGEGGNSRVVKFTKDGKFIKTWGTKGAGDGQLSTPHNIAMDSKGRVWVADRGNSRVQVFDQDGKYLNQFAQFGAPVSIAFGKDDLMYVADGAPENKIVIGTTEGKVLEVIEGLNNAHGMSVDSNGNIYVAESFGHNLLKFVRK